jgi:hypothetical protein
MELASFSFNPDGGGGGNHEENSQMAEEPGERGDMALDMEEFFDEFDAELEYRCTMMRFKTQELCESLKSAFLVELMKLPTKVKCMPMQEFLQLQGTGNTLASLRAEFSASLLKSTANKSMIQQTASKKNTTRIPNPQTSASGANSMRKLAKQKNDSLRTDILKSQAFNHALGTPAGNRFNHQKFPPSTPAVRDPKNGECILSMNGSPLGAFSTVRATVRPHFNVPATPTISVSLPGATGSYINIADPNALNQLDEENKEHALNELGALEATIADIVRRIRNG